MRDRSITTLAVLVAGLAGYLLATVLGAGDSVQVVASLLGAVLGSFAAVVGGAWVAQRQEERAIAQTAEAIDGALQTAADSVERLKASDLDDRLDYPIVAEELRQIVERLIDLRAFLGHFYPFKELRTHDAMRSLLALYEKISAEQVSLERMYGQLGAVVMLGDVRRLSAEVNVVADGISPLLEQARGHLAVPRRMRQRAGPPIQQVMSSTMWYRDQIVLDFREASGDPGRLKVIPYDGDMTLGELVEEGRQFLGGPLEPFDYGNVWVFKDKSDGTVISDLRMINRQGAGALVPDNRPLKTTTVRAGSWLIAERT